MTRPPTWLILGLVLAQAPDVAKDLTAVIALQGQPCDTVVSYEKRGENDYVARCRSGDVYRVYVNEQGRVVVVKQ
jgi:mRNA-degrading endonuclease RelE of RelBE toxin-antitoxin system